MRIDPSTIAGDDERRAAKKKERFIDELDTDDEARLKKRVDDACESYMPHERPHRDFVVYAFRHRARQDKRAAAALARGLHDSLPEIAWTDEADKHSFERASLERRRRAAVDGAAIAGIAGDEFLDRLRRLSDRLLIRDELARFRDELKQIELNQLEARLLRDHPRAVAKVLFRLASEEARSPHITVMHAEHRAHEFVVRATDTESTKRGTDDDDARSGRRRR